MSNDPYRRHDEPSGELARLAQQGQMRMRAAHQGEDAVAIAAADTNLRTAIGPVRGAPVKRAMLVLSVSCVLALIAAAAFVTFVDDSMFGIFQLVPFLVPGIMASVGFFLLYVFLPPMASRASVEAERAWAASLPFALDWYFELLSSRPSSEHRVVVDLWWNAQAVDAPTLQGIIALFHPESVVREAKDGHASFTTGPISGSTGIRIDRRSVYRNHRLGKEIHRLVDVVLMPIHRNAPLVRVRLSLA